MKCGCCDKNNATTYVEYATRPHQTVVCDTCVTVFDGRKDAVIMPIDQAIRAGLLPGKDGLYAG